MDTCLGTGRRLPVAFGLALLDCIACAPVAWAQSSSIARLALRFCACPASSVCLHLSLFVQASSEFILAEERLQKPLGMHALLSTVRLNLPPL